jgi:ribosomal protein L7/L12
MMVRCTSCAQYNPPGLPRCQNCGAELPASTGPALRVDDDLGARVRSLTDSDRKIEAIKLFREWTGAGLKEAKDAVEAIERGQSPPATSVGDRAFEDELATLLERGQKIEAIKRYRERTGVGLKEAKDAVERMAERHGLVMSQRAGCLGVVLLALISLVWLVGLR